MHFSAPPPHAIAANYVAAHVVAAHVPHIRATCPRTGAVVRFPLTPGGSLAAWQLGWSQFAVEHPQRCTSQRCLF